MNKRDKREMHPNSLKAIREATERRSKPTGKRVNVFLTEEAIASLDQAASARGISRSELVEQYARSGCGEQFEALKEAVLFYLVSTKGCAPDRLNSELILDSLNRLQEAFERSRKPKKSTRANC